MARSLIARLGTKFEFMPDGCWQWTAARSTSGYGKVYSEDARSDYAHRVMYRLLVGPIADGLTVDHLCWNTLCVNPAHMELVPLIVNRLRAPLKTHCKRGHEFTPENTHVNAGGQRWCKACWRIRKRAEYARKRSIEVQGA